MSNQNLISPYLITLVDILGFEALIRKKPLSKVYEKMLDLLKSLEKAQVIGTIEVVGYRTEQRNLTDLPYLVYSDSVLIYREISKSNDNESSPENDAFSEMLLGLEEIFKVAFKLRVWLRAGMAYGNAIIQCDPNGINNILIGQPIIDAYQTERAQNWMGCAFHRSCEKIIENSKIKDEILVLYPIPLKKDNKVPILKYALGWVDAKISQLNSNFDRWKTNNTAQENIKKNTQEFFHWCIDRPARVLGFRIEF